MMFTESQILIKLSLPFYARARYGRQGCPGVRKGRTGPLRGLAHCAAAGCIAPSAHHNESESAVRP